MSRELSESEIDEIYAFAIQLGKDAGQMLLDGMLARMGGRAAQANVEKDSSVDIVTKTDEGMHFIFLLFLRSYIVSLLTLPDVESFIHTSISKKFPSHQFIGEESYSKGASKTYLLTPSPTWIVDPLDGTVNYTHLYPTYCVSIGFCIDSKPFIGVVNAPFLSQLFYACRGRGAWFSSPSLGAEPRQLPLVRDPIPPLPELAPKGCVFSCEWGKDRRDRPDGNMYRKVETFLNMAAEIGGRGGKGGMVHGVRSIGSATLDLAYVALGGVDIWVEGGCWEWDVCASWCILEEAGGLVTTMSPPDGDLENARIEEGRLGSRLYLAIRATGDKEGETGRSQQERLVREVWKRVCPLDYTRPGL
ncbi:Inositol monophosphatase-like protein 2 [Elsinoe fawcettii]|nr:Inositol monophosphatase-like protein 2 [Elsinoe fawcettii]